MRFRTYKSRVGVLSDPELSERLTYITRSSFEREGRPTPEDSLAHFERAERIAVAEEEFPAAFAVAYRLDDSTVVQDGLAVRPEHMGEGIGEELLDFVVEDFAGPGDILLGKTQHPWIIDYYQERDGFPQNGEELPEGAEKALDRYTDAIGVERDGCLVREGYPENMYPEEDLREFTKAIEEMTGEKPDLKRGDYILTGTRFQDPSEFSDTLEDLTADGGKSSWQALEKLGVEPVSPVGKPESLETILDELGEYESPVVVDFGAGDLQFLSSVNDRFPEARTVGIDRRKPDSGLDGVEFLLGGPEQIDETEDVDVFSAFNVLQEMENPRTVVESFQNQLEPGGKILATYPGPRAEPGFDSITVDFGNVEQVFPEKVRENPWIRNLELFRQRYFDEQEVQDIFSGLEVRHGALEAEITDSTRELLRSQGYIFPEAPVVDYTVARKC